jgi:hypothetical protein
MPIVTSVIARTINKPSGARGIHEEHTDANGVLHEYRYVAPPAGQWDEVAALAAHALEVEARIVRDEVKEDSKALKNDQPERTPAEQAQADYDRRMLAEFMQEEDAHVFLKGLEFFQAFEARAGANGPQRAAYLGVTLADYNLVAARFGDVQGAAFFLNDDKNQVWDAPLPGWE